MGLEFLLIFLISIFAGFFGALLGVGGGAIIVPALTLIFKLPIHQAIAASIVSVIATSIAGALSYVDQKITNIRLGMFLEIFTTFGALAGALVAVMLKAWVLSLIFGTLIIFMAILSFIQRSKDEELLLSGRYNNHTDDKLSKYLELEASYHDEALSRDIAYNATGLIKGGLISTLAGIGSGLLGIGGGVIKVSAMNSFMRVPIKAAVATSKFMIGVTAATSGVIYFLACQVNEYIVAPVALGTMLGATIGSLVMNKLHSRVIKLIFTFLMIYLGYEMFVKGMMLGFNIRLPGLL